MRHRRAGATDMFHPQGPTFWELARQALSSTEHGYDLLAPKFDLTPFRTPDEILSGLASVLGEPKSIDEALDLCCGTGAAIQILRPLCRRRVVGYDFSQGMLDQARRQYGDRKDGECPVEFVRGDALQLPFENQFDLVVTVGSLGHIVKRDQDHFIAGIVRGLRPGGRLALVTGNLPSVLSAGYWLARGFNGAMHLRNLLHRPPFVMFYLTFLLPEVQALLERHGLSVTVHSGVFAGRFRRLKVVVATKPVG